MKVPKAGEVLAEVKEKEVKHGKWEKGNGEKGIVGKAVTTGDRPVSLFQFLREKPVLQSIMAEYEAKKATLSELSTA